MTTLTTSVLQDDFTAKAAQAFDFPFTGTTEFTLPEFTPPSGAWSILLIQGPSGSGKSSILREYFGAAVEPAWDANKAVVSHFDTPEDAVLRLSSVGLNSIPAWCRPRHVLSGGEGHRADLARQLYGGAVIDEFTSTVNREAARSTAVGVRRLVDKLGLQRVVIATCHYDVAEWLQPDWLFDTATGVMTPRGSLHQRPRISLDILPASPAIWPVFAPHHYLTAKLAAGANCWVAVWDGVIVGFASSIPFPHGHIKNGYREHRTVVLPDYQGLGLGVRLSDAIAQLHRDAGKRYYSKTAHPRMGQYRDAHPMWRASSSSGKREVEADRSKSGIQGKGWAIDLVRVCYSHEYVGVPTPPVVLATPPTTPATVGTRRPAGSLSIDFETRATFDLRAGGVYPYAMHKDTDLWCFAWAFDGEEPEIWHPGLQVGGLTGVPGRFIDHILAGGEMRAWNAAFERIIWKHILTPRYGFPEPKLEQWVCSAAEAAAMSLPRSLDQAAKVTGVAEQKDSAGYELMMRMTRPRKVNADGSLVWWDVEERKQRLFEYCRQDVRTEQAIVKVLRRLTPREREIYLLTERMNDRGIRLDRELVLAAKDVADEGLERANAVLRELTGGAVTEVTKTGQMKQWLGEQGVPNGSVAKAAVRELLESDLDPTVRKVVELRAEAGRSSLAKLDSMLECVCDDDRIRGMLLYHGATTGRWTGRLAQLHNLPRPDIDNIEDFIPDVLACRYDTLDLFHNPLAVVVSMLRSMVTASEGYELLAADYAAIEARVLNWFADQRDILQLFAAGEDVYSYNAGRLPGAEPYARGKKHPWRQTGKFQELGCGYQMGWKKAISAAKTVYGLTLTEADARVIVSGYRETHDKVVAFWNESDAAALAAVSKPGAPVVFGALRNLKFMCAGAYLYLVLPAKRPLVYPAPKIVERPTPWGERKPAVEISCVNPVTRQWGREQMYGGLWVENIVQAASRDIMADAKLRLEASGYPVLLSVHDEIVSERKTGEGDLTEFERLVAASPEWAPGLPVAAEGWRGARYRK